MAIAYFIPDQAKLLAGQRSSRGSNSSSSRSSNNSEPASRLPQSNTPNETAPVNTTVNRGYGTTINISVPTFNNTTQEPLGCWEFLTQVFCHALRFYHESSQLQPTVIQISVNFNSQMASSATNPADTMAPPTATGDSQRTPTATPTATDSHQQRKFSKRKN